MASKIYNIPVAQSTTSASGSKSNPIYKGSLNSPYTNYLSKTQYSVLDYAANCTDFRVLYYAFTGKLPSLTKAAQARLAAQDAAEKNTAKQTNSTSKQTDTTSNQTKSTTQTTHQTSKDTDNSNTLETTYGDLIHTSNESILNNTRTQSNA